MRLAVISDIHSNLEALLAVLAKCREENMDQIICLGDIIGYGPNPRECLILVRRNCQVILRGNHEVMALDLEKYRQNINSLALVAIEYALGKLNQDDLKFLDSLPLIATANSDFTFAHSNFKHPEDWQNYIDEWCYYHVEANYLKNRIGVLGHTHKPFIYSSDNSQHSAILKDRPDNWLTLDRGEKYIFNVGSVGQPRQGIFKASFGIFEIDDQSLKIRFKLVYVDYDVDKTIEKIIAAKLPSGLADRLYHG